MVVRDSLLMASVTEHTQLLLVFPPHIFFLSACTLETTEFSGTAKSVAAAGPVVYSDRTRRRFTDRVPGLLFLLVFAFAPLAAPPQDVPSHPKPGGKVCVATVSNMSARAALVDRLTERVSKDLRDDKINAVTMDSSTTTDHKLHPTRENGEEAKSKDCDYILLTQIVDPKTRPFDPQSPQISIGGKVPSVDASDPLGGSSGPVYRDNLQISFALFPMDRLKPVVDTVIMAQPSGNASDNLLPAMDRESSRVGHELKKK
jgi:hypothetical protein